MKQNKRFAKWLGETRRAAGLTQEQLATALDVSQAAVSYWEDMGRLAMEPGEIVQLAAILHVRAYEVAEALGYPTRPAALVTVPLSPDVLTERLAALSLQLGEVVEQWARETFPQAAGHERHDRNE